MGLAPQLVQTATVRTPASTNPEPIDVAAKILAAATRKNGFDIAALKRDLDSVSAQDPALGNSVREIVESWLTPVQRGQLDATGYSLGGLRIVPGYPSTADQFKAPVGSALPNNYNALDAMFGDKNPKTNDVVLIDR